MFPDHPNKTAEPLKIGKITAAVGIRGEVRVYPYVDALQAFGELENVRIGTADYPVKSARVNKGMAIVKFGGVDDRNTAERLRGLEIHLCEESNWRLPEDTYLVRELIGLRVVTQEDVYVGVVVDVIQNPGHDLYEIRDEYGKSFLLPAVKEFVLNIDIPASSMTVQLIEGMK